MAEYIDREKVLYQMAKQATIDGQPRAIKRAMKIVAEFPRSDVVSIDESPLCVGCDGKDGNGSRTELCEYQKDGKKCIAQSDKLHTIATKYYNGKFTERLHGSWGYRWKVHGDGRRPTELFPCTECGYENTSATNFCPNCGADMRGDE